jgi:thioredoxin reductase
MVQGIDLTLETSLAIIGAGPAGLSAAVTAAQLGVDCLLIERLTKLGGQFLGVHPDENPEVGIKNEIYKIHQMIKHLEWFHVRVLNGSIIERIESSHVMYLLHNNGNIRIKYKALLVATGARERVLPFRGWTLPGVLTIGAAQRLVARDSVTPGQRVLVAGSGPLLLSSAAQLVRAGVQVSGVIEATPKSRLLSKGMIALSQDFQTARRAIKDYNTLHRANVPFLMGHVVVKADGDEYVERVNSAALDDKGKIKPGSERCWEVDALCVGHGLIPNTRVCQSLSCEMDYDPQEGSFYVHHGHDLQTSCPSVFVAGEVAGIGGVNKALIEGELVGLQAAISLGCSDEKKLIPRFEKLYSQRKQYIHQYKNVRSAFMSPPMGCTLASPDTLICRCEEVSLQNLKISIQEGDGTLRDLKMRTRLGMGLCQGRFCESNAHQELAALTGQKPEDIVPLRVRPPLEPLPVEAMAGLDKSVDTN